MTIISLNGDGDNGNGGDGDGGNRHGGNGDGGNGNGGNGNPNENGRGDRLVAKECTYQDFMKCQPLNFKGTEGVVRLIRLEVNQRDNCEQQPPFKSPNVGGQNVARAYTANNNERNRIMDHFLSATNLKDQNRGYKAGNKNGVGEARGKAYVLGGGEANPDSNVVKGHPFNIDLMPVELDSFDVIIGMDWLANHHAMIICDEKIVRISYEDEVLIVQGDRDDKGEKLKLSIISCTKT
ncbi:putative reverse transcriptase domain-containing protein [Tanacetum coccineum]